jgi:hypothetical protein
MDVLKAKKIKQKDRKKIEEVIYLSYSKKSIALFETDLPYFVHNLLKKLKMPTMYKISTYSYTHSDKYDAAFDILHELACRVVENQRGTFMNYMFKNSKLKQTT